jgi:hypothetical protein
MLTTLINIIQSLNIVDGKLSAMTENQMDEFARNIPDGKTSCNVFGVGGYSRNQAGVMTKQVRICLLKQMPVNFDLKDIDIAEIEMSMKLFSIFDKLEDSGLINVGESTDITPELLRYDRAILLTYFDVTVFGNTKAVCS